MRKKKMCAMCLLTALLVAGLAGAVVVVLKHEPGFYRHGQLLPSPERKDLAGTFVSNFVMMLNDIRSDKWSYQFSEAQINSFLAEEFARWGEDHSLRKLGISEPRVMLEEGRLRLGFRYGYGVWSTVVSYDLNVWLAPREPNAIAVEIRSRRAGALPISSQALLNELAEAVRRNNMEMSLYRRDGNPVVLIRLQGDPGRPRAVLECLRITPGTLTVAGASAEAAEAGPTRRAGAPAGD